MDLFRNEVVLFHHHMIKKLNNSKTVTVKKPASTVKSKGRLQTKREKSYSGHDDDDDIDHARR